MTVERQTEILEISLGNLGSIAVTGEATITAPTGVSIRCIIPLVDSTVTAQTNASGIATQELTTFENLPAGIPLYVKCTSITFGAGSQVSVYYG